MRRLNSFRIRFGVILVALVLAVLAVVPAFAIPTTDLTRLASNFEADTQFFAAIRTDDGYIETLDGLLARVNDLLPAGQSIPVTLQQTLDQAFTRADGSGTFEESVRSWLGATAAIGIKNLDNAFDTDGSNDSETPLLIALESTDRQAAVDFFTASLPTGDPSGFVNYSMSEADRYTVFTPDGQFTEGSVHIFIADDVVLLTPQPVLIPGPALAPSSLATSASFIDGVASLPGDDYNILLYLDLVGLVESSFASMSTSSMDTATAASIEQLTTAFEQLGAQVWGFTITDGRSLTIDIAQSVDYTAMIEATGMDMMLPLPAFDQAFTRFIPANTPLVIGGSALGPSIQNALTSLEMQADQLAAQTGGDADDILQAFAQIEFAVQGITGLDLEDEILPWMDGDYALWVSVSPALGDLTSPNDINTLETLPVDFALLIETSDPAQTALLVTGIQQALESFVDEDVTVTTEEIGGGTTILITAPIEGVDYPLELAIGSNDTLLALGTRSAVEYALAPEGPSLVDDPLYQESLVYALPGTSAYAYLAGNGLQPLVGLVAFNSADAENFQFVLDLFHSSSISSVTTMTEGVFRAVLTLPE